MSARPTSKPKPIAGHILVVDDEELLCRAITAYLTKAGFAVTCFHNGRDALRWLNDGHADVVVTDVFMPDSDGVELLCRLRQRTLRPKTIVMSGGSNVWELAFDVARILGADATLAKPFELAALLRQIRMLAGPPPPISVGPLPGVGDTAA